ncbi:MAG TPA: carboxypeptidase-like regulatory domain-containing protein [Polyangiales bacterium]|nr:carboxypeptidase-like regulatory domain-containing protein [Polyangiales bacterium]
MLNQTGRVAAHGGKRVAARCVMLMLMGGVLALAARMGLDSPTGSAVDAPVRADDRTHVQAIEHATQPAISARWTLSGFVRNEQGAAVAQAQVCAVCAVCDSSLGTQTLCAATEASGAYSLDVEDFKAVTLTASAAGYRLGQANAGRPIQAQRPSRADTDIVLHADGARLAGTVVDALGGPIAAARVQLWRVAGSVQSLVETLSDEDGRFELWAAPGGSSLRVEAASYAPATRWLVAPSQGISVQLTPASSVSGTVVESSTGRPVRGVEVRALFEGMRGRSTAAVSGDDGRFTLTGLEPGSYLLAAEHERFRARAPVPVQLGLAQVEKSLIVPVIPAVSVLGKLVSTQEDTCLGGWVSLDPSGVPQPDAAERGASIAKVELDGSLKLRGLTPGHYKVDVHCAEQVLAEGPTQLDVRGEDLAVTWRMELGVGLDVTVLDAADAPVPRAAVVMRWPNPEHPDKHISSPLTADETGHVVTGTHLRPGRYTLKPGGGLRGEPVTVELLAGAGRVPASMHLQGSAWIDVDVQDEHAQPIDGLHVSARVEGQSVPARPRGGGAYRIGPLEAGRYAVTAADGVNRSWAEELLLDVQSASTVRTKLTIERGASLQGNVVDARGQPAANVWVSVKDEAVKRERFQAPAAQRRLTDTEGHFSIDGLSQRGRFVIRVNDPEAGEGTMHDVQPGASVHVSLKTTTPIASSASDR